MKEIDSLIIGHNQPDYEKLLQYDDTFYDNTGVLVYEKYNSLLIENKRVGYTQLLNKAIEFKSGSNPNYNSFNLPNLGVLYLTNYLREKNLSVEFINNFNSQKKELIDFLQKKPLTIVITTTYYYHFYPIVEIIKFVREYNTAVKIITGGPYFYSLVKSSTKAEIESKLKLINADFYIIDAQGETTLSKIVLAIKQNSSFNNISNLIFPAQNNRFTYTTINPEKNDLTKHRILWNKFPQQQFTPTVFVRTQKGCAYNCAFCSYNAFEGQRAFIDLDILEKEFIELHNAGVKYILFVDDTFNVPLSRFKNILKMMIRNKFNFNWYSYFRAGNVDDETFDLLAKSGCKGVMLGIESGDQNILNLMNKRVTIAQYENTIRRLKANGIIMEASIIIGFPGETKESVMRTYEFIERNSPSLYFLELYSHDVFAPIHKRSKELGIKGASYFWEHNTMNWQEACQYIEFILKNVNNSIYSLMDMCIWTFPYFFEKGFNLKTILNFQKAANKLIINSLDTQFLDISPYLAELTNSLNPKQPE